MNKRKAILTCSTKYTSSPLKFPSNDVDSIASVFKERCKFEEDDIKKIVHQSGCEDNSFIENLKKICEDIDAEKKDVYDLIIFYYSGHGIYKNSEQMSFLQISDDNYIPIDEIMNITLKVKSRNTYFIIDACESGGISLEMTPKIKKTARTHIHHSDSTYCMFGATKDKLSYEPSTKHIIKKNIKNSYYTHFIIEALNTRANYSDDTISIKIVDDYASKKTPQYTGFDQIPFSTMQSVGFFPLGFWDQKDDFDDINDWNKNQEDSEVYLHHQEDLIVEYLIQKIQQLFIDKDFVSMFNITEPLEELSPPAIDHLNKKLDLTNKEYDSKPLVNGLLSSNIKNHFLSFILREPKIYIDVNLKDTEGKTALAEAIDTDRDNELVNDMIRDLFIKGYKLSEDEENSFKEQIRNKSVRGKQIERMVVALVCNKLKDESLIRKFKKIEKIMFSFLSFRLKVVVGYKINHLALANNFLEHHKDFSSLFIKALRKYGYYNEFKTKASFIKKENIIKTESPYQEDAYNDILRLFFPQLFEE